MSKFPALILCWITSNFLCLPLNAQTTDPNQQLKQVQVQDGKFTVGDPTPTWIEDVRLPPADAGHSIVFRLVDTQFLVADVPVAYFHTAVTFNDAGALSSFNQLPVDFTPDYQKLQIHSIRIHRGDDTLDRTKSAAVRFLQRDIGLEQGVYSDVVTASILLEDLRVGDTVEYSYSISGQNPVFDGRYVEHSSWEYSQPVGLRRAVLNYPTNRHINWRLVGDVAGKSVGPVESDLGNMHKLVFEEAAIPEVIAEPSLPADFMRLRWLQFSEFTDWNDVARWADKLFAVSTTASPEFDKIVEELRSLKSDEDRIARALEVAQSDIRYFSVALGESSHRPAQPGEVLRRRYGDCKDKSFLLTALLRAVAIDSRPMLLSVRRGKGLDKSLPSPLSFDHAIVEARLGKRAFYLDATRLGQHGRLDRMGQANEGSEGLVVGADTKALTTIKTSNIADLVRSEVSETAHISALGGDGEIHSQMIWNGVEAELQRIFFQQLSRERIQAIYGEYVAKNYPGAKLIGDVAFSDDRQNNILSVTMRFSVPKLTSENGQFWYLRFTAANLYRSIAPLPTSGRIAPLAMPSFPYEASYKLSVEFPTNVHVPAGDFKHSVKGRIFTYDAALSYAGSDASTRVTLKVLAPAIEAKDFKAYSDDIGKLNNTIGLVVPLSKKFVKPGKIAAKEGIGKRWRQQGQDQILAQTKAMNSGTLKGEALLEAYCQRSLQSAFLGKLKEAYADLDAVDKLFPHDVAPVVARGEVNLRAGQFDTSIADFTRAISLDGKNAWSFQARGMDRFYTGDYEGAAADFSKATELGDDWRRPYTDLWLAAADRRLNRDLPEDLKTRAAADPRGSWPRPILAAMTDVITTDELMAIIESKEGDDKITATTEANFYLAQRLLDRGERTAAEELFKKALATDAYPYLEFISTKFELAALSAKDRTVTSSGSPTNSASATVTAPTTPADSMVQDHTAKAASAGKRKPSKNNPNWNTNALQAPF